MFFFSMRLISLLFAVLSVLVNFHISLHFSVLQWVCVVILVYVMVEAVSTWFVLRVFFFLVHASPFLTPFSFSLFLFFFLVFSRVMLSKLFLCFSPFHFSVFCSPSSCFSILLFLPFSYPLLFIFLDLFLLFHCISSLNTIPCYYWSSILRARTLIR